MAKPWLDEPDQINFEYRGIDCMVLRNAHLGNLCGYICLSPEHPAFGKGYDALHEEHEDEELGHGGLTYARDRNPLTGETELDAWYLGFDAAHYGDYLPKHEKLMGGVYSGPGDDGVYRDMTYMRRACKQLVDVLAKES